MKLPDLLQTLTRGEDSRHQFKRDATNADGMAAEVPGGDERGAGPGERVSDGPGGGRR